MRARSLTERIEILGANDWSRRVFDSFIPIPEGTSYNAYLVRGSDKTVLIDSVEPTMAHGFLAALESVERIDHVISLHAEQDHSGTIPEVLERYPQATLLTSKKAVPMLQGYLQLPADRIIEVADGEALSLGDRTLRFIHTPWVHWPETMCAFLEEEGALFSCDFFGSHLAAAGPYVPDQARVLDAARRYYATIMMPFAKVIRRNLDKLAPLDIELIAPSHGPVHPDPGFMLDAYRTWSAGTVEDRVVVAYDTMHHSTQGMVEHLAGELLNRSIEVDLFPLAETDMGRLAMSVLGAATLILGTPTVLGGPHPNVVNAAYVLSALKPPVRTLGIIGSCGWSAAKTEKQLLELTRGLRAELLPSVITQGMASAETRDRLRTLADTIAARHEALGIRTN